MPNKINKTNQIPRIGTNKKYSTFHEVKQAIKELQEKFKNINFKTGMVGDALRIPLQRGIYASSSSNELLKEVPEKYNNILIVKKLTPT